MNIAILIPELGGGGAERAATLLGDYYYNKGYKVYFFLGDINIRKKYHPKGKIVRTGIDIDYTDIKNDLELYVKLLRDSFVMRKLKTQYRIDVAISFMEAFNYLNILSYQGEKNIVSIRTILSERKDFNELIYKRRNIKLLYGLSKCVICVSRYAAEDLSENYSVKKNKIYCIPNAVADISSNTEKEWMYGTEVLLAIGRLEEVKQHEIIIRAFSYVAEKNDNARLLIIGDGPLKNRLKAIISRLNLENRVFLLGFQHDIGYFMKNSKAFIMASKAEGFPNSMIEAMSLGLPVISMDSPGGVAEILGGKSQGTNTITYQKYGIITPYICKDTEGKALFEEEIALGKAMLTLLENEKLQKKYKEQSLQRASYYSKKNVMKKWDKLILEERK